MLLAMICLAGYAQETEFTADRPGASTGPGVVGHRVIQLEQGALTQQLYEDFSKTLEENLQMKTDMHEVQQKVAKHNIARYLKTKTEANVLLLTVSYDLMIFNKHVYEAIINVANVLNRNLETHKPTGIHLEEYKRRPVEAEYWRKLYLPELS